MVQVRNKLTTAEAEAMGLEAAREWERERQAEQAAFDEEAKKQGQKQDFIAPLLDAGISQRDAEEAYKQHILESAKQHGERARALHWASRSRAV
jgi:hypothetical protein